MAKANDVGEKCVGNPQKGIFRMRRVGNQPVFSPFSRTQLTFYYKKLKHSIDSLDNLLYFHFI